MDVSQISITTNEISDDFVTALEIGTSWGIRHFELKNILGRRVPDIDDAYVNRMKKELNIFGADIAAVSPGMFMGTEVGSDKAKLQATELLEKTIAMMSKENLEK